jgi:hypothetical protein
MAGRGTRVQWGGSKSRSGKEAAKMERQERSRQKQAARNNRRNTKNGTRLAGS